MEKRRFGKTDHRSSVAIFGAAALGEAGPEEAQAALQLILKSGVNHIDVAPSYGQAEERLGPLLPPVRDRFFLGCKTMERTRSGVAAEMQRSLKKLGVEYFDLYQIHAITRIEELDQATGPGGALEAMVQARRDGFTRFIGITGHGMQAPALFSEALNRFDFDTILFPVNFILFADPAYRADAQALLKKCHDRDVGVMAIKAIAQKPWGESTPTATTWYRPFDDLKIIQPAVNFALSQDVTGLCTAGDLRVLPLFLQACEDFHPLSPADQVSLIATAAQYETIF